MEMNGNMYKKIINREGLSIITIIMIIALIAVIIVSYGDKIVFHAKEQIINIKEYSLRMSMKKTKNQIDQILKFSKDICIMPKAFATDTSGLDPSYNYIMVSSDCKRIINMEYDGSKFVERVIEKKRRNIKYEIFFEKGPESVMGNTVKCEIDIHIIDPKENIHKRDIVFEYMSEPLIATQIVDKGTGISKRDFRGASPSVVLAYSQNR